VLKLKYSVRACVCVCVCEGEVFHFPEIQETKAKHFMSIPSCSLSIALPHPPRHNRKALSCVNRHAWGKRHTMWWQLKKKRNM